MKLSAEICKAAIVTASLGATLVLAAPAHARENPGETTRLSIKEIDFSSPAEVADFYSRLETAAHKVCDIAGNGLEVLEDNADCRMQAIQRVVADLEKPRLNELHVDRTREEARLADARSSRNW